MSGQTTDGYGRKKTKIQYRDDVMTESEVCCCVTTSSHTHTHTHIPAHRWCSVRVNYCVVCWTSHSSVLLNLASSTAVMRYGSHD